MNDINKVKIKIEIAEKENLEKIEVIKSMARNIFFSYRKMIDSLCDNGYKYNKSQISLIINNKSTPEHVSLLFDRLNSIMK